MDNNQLVHQLKRKTHLLSDTKLNNCIEKIVEVKRQYQLSPTQNRYIDSRTRQVLKLQIPTREKPLPDYLNPAEIYKIIEVAYTINAFDGLIIEFLIYTGLRINECRNLMIQDLDFNNNQLKVVRGKGSKDRYVPISNHLLQKIKHFIGERSRGYLFSKDNNTQYSVRALQKKIEKVINKCQFSKKLSTHSLRHTFACLCLAKGLRIEDIKLIMGHTSVKTTEIYAKLELGDIKQKYLALVGG